MPISWGGFGGSIDRQSYGSSHSSCLGHDASGRVGREDGRRDEARTHT